MRKRSIEVVVSPDGSLAIDTVGFSGTDCVKATAFLEQALGEVEYSKKKPEYHRHNSTRKQQRLGRE